MTNRGVQSPQAIQNEIEQTRSRIEQRLEVLSHDVSPGNLISRALGTEQASLPDAVNSAVQVARANPIAACMALAGLAGLAIGGTRNPATSNPQPATTTHHPDVAKRVGDSAATLKERAAQAAERVQKTATDLTNQVSGTASSTAEAVSSSAASTSGFVRETAAAVSDTIERTVGQIEAASGTVTRELKAAPVRARVSGDHAVAWIKHNPVPAGLAAIAAGAVAASIFTARRAETPATRAEAGRELFEKAQERGSPAANNSAASDSKKSGNGAPNGHANVAGTGRTSANTDVHAPSERAPTSPRQDAAPDRNRSLASARVPAVATTAANSTRAPG